MDRLIENYINGNLTAARRQAKRLGYTAIYAALLHDYGKSAEAAAAITAYLKGRGTFQDACDAEQEATR